MTMISVSWKENTSRQFLRTLLFLATLCLLHCTTSHAFPSDFGNLGSVPPPSSLSPQSIDPITERGPAFEDHIAAWRQQQMERAKQFESLPPERQAAVNAAGVDDQGRTKLINTVSRSSLCFWFFILMWRAMAHYEMADTIRNQGLRVIMVLPSVLLFIGNMLGCVISFTSSQQHGTKKRLKGLLNVNKLVEIIMFLYHFMRLTLFPNKYVPREVYVGKIVHNFMYLLASQMFTKVTWDAAVEAPVGSGSGSYPGSTSGFYDSYDGGRSSSGAGYSSTSGQQAYGERGNEAGSQEEDTWY